MAYDGRVFDLVLLHESPDVLCHGHVVMARVVRGVAMISKILWPIISLILW